MAAGGILVSFANTIAVGIPLLIWGVGGMVAEIRIGFTQAKLGRIIDEVQSGFYSGRVLAERLEQLNHSRFEVPSILVEVLHLPRT